MYRKSQYKESSGDPLVTVPAALGAEQGADNSRAVLLTYFLKDLKNNKKKKVCLTSPKENINPRKIFEAKGSML